MQLVKAAAIRQDSAEAVANGSVTFNRFSKCVRMSWLQLLITGAVSSQVKHHNLNVGGGGEGKLEENQSHFQPEVGNWKFTVSCIRIPADCHLRRSNWKFIIHSVYEWYGNNGTAAIGLLIYAWQYHLHITHLHMKPLHKQWMWFHRFPTSWLPLILRDPQRFLSGGGLRRMASLPASRASHRHTPHPRSNETFQVNQSMNLYQHFNGLNKKE